MSGPDHTHGADPDTPPTRDGTSGSSGADDAAVDPAAVPGPQWPTGDEPTTVVPREQLAGLQPQPAGEPPADGAGHDDAVHHADVDPAENDAAGDAGDAVGYHPAGHTPDSDAERTQLFPGPTHPAGYSSQPAYSATPPEAAPAGPANAGPATAPYGGPPGYAPAGPYPAQGYPGPGDAGAAQGGFFAPQPPRVELAPARSRAPQNLGGALIGLVLTLGAAVVFALIADKLNMVADAAAMAGGAAPEAPDALQKLAFFGLVLLAALPALLAGWAPATSWVPGVVVLLVSGICWFSQELLGKIAEFSVNAFDTAGLAVFIQQVGVPLGLGLLFAGLGAVWARRSGVLSVTDRMGGGRY